MTNLKRSIEISQEVSEEHGEGLYGLTSFGNESALLFEVLHSADVQPRFVTIDTGFWFPETHEFKDRLTEHYGFDLEVYGPDPTDIEDIIEARLWETDIDEYHEITKHEPLTRAIGELGITGLFSGVRHGQTANRSTLGVTEEGAAGEIRIHPLLHWTESEAEAYFSEHGLPRHPLHAAGYGSVGDWTTTSPGQGRAGRELPASECGLHVTADGRLVRAAS